MACSVVVFVDKITWREWNKSGRAIINTTLAKEGIQVTSPNAEFKVFCNSRGRGNLNLVSFLTTRFRFFVSGF